MTKRLSETVTWAELNNNFEVIAFGGQFKAKDIRTNNDDGKT